MDIIKIKKDCLERWETPIHKDKRLQFFDEKFNEWFSQIPNDYQKIVSILLKNLYYYSKGNTNKYLAKLNDKLNIEANITEENTIYVFIVSKDGKSNSSNDYWTEFKLINDIPEDLFVVDMSCIYDEGWKYIDNIVFIDDFSGTGKSFTDELSKNVNRYKNKNVYFLTIHMMEEAINHIKEYAKSQSINIKCININVQNKAFESNIFPNNIETKQKIETMSKNFLIQKDVFGFENSQSLVAFHNNTPNNTIAFIWKSTDKYFSIFPRRTNKKRNWDIKNRQKLQKIKNYNMKASGNTYA